MRDELLSIIVPIYNVRQYLDRAVQSILNQTYRNLEVILIDDGSTDGSGEICRKYAALDARVRFISQENQGASAARRNGIRQAAGQYISFVDPDDYIDADLYRQLMACREDYDVVIAQWMRESGGTVRRAYDQIAPGGYRTPAEMDFLIRHLINVSTPGGAVQMQSGIAAYLWNKLFKAELVKEAVEEISVDLPISNDRPVIYGVMLKCKSVLITEICGYHYIVRDGSLGHSLDQNCRYLRNLCEFYNLMASMFAEDHRRDILMPQLHLKIAEEITRVPQKMGFAEEAHLQLKVPVFPFLNLLDGKRIALYGAGAVGRSYWRQIQKYGVCHAALWVDRDWEEYSRTGLPVSPVERLSDTDVDYIILTAADKALAEKERQELAGMGIDGVRILWKAPLAL